MASSYTDDDCSNGADSCEDAEEDSSLDETKRNGGGSCGTRRGNVNHSPVSSRRTRLTQIRSKRKESEKESEPLVEESSPILGIDHVVDNDKRTAEQEKETSGRDQPAFGYRCYRAGRNSFIWTALFLAMILPYSVVARPTGLFPQSLERRTVRTQRATMEMWNAIRNRRGRNSAFWIEPGSGLMLNREPVHGEILDIQAHTILGFSITIGHGVMYRGNVVTGSHVAWLSSIFVGSKR